MGVGRAALIATGPVDRLIDHVEGGGEFADLEQTQDRAAEIAQLEFDAHAAGVVPDAVQGRNAGGAEEGDAGQIEHDSIRLETDRLRGEVGHYVNGLDVDVAAYIDDSDQVIT